MLSLANTYSETEVTEFYDRVKKSLNEDFEICCEMKYDGTSISLTYENGKLVRAVTHRFRETPHPLQTLDAYLKAVYDESLRRGYHFDPQKITPMEPLPLLLLPDKQLEYEFRHLLNKLRKRDLLRYASLLTAPFILPHPLFRVEPGEMCPWEKPREEQ